MITQFISNETILNSVLTLILLLVSQQILKHCHIHERNKKKIDDDKYYEPPLVPYYVPYFGSMITWLKDPIGFMKLNSKLLQTNVFRMYSRRMTCIIVTDPTIVSSVILSGKYTQKLSWKNVKYKLLSCTGLSHDVAAPFSTGNEAHILDSHIKNSVSLSQILYKIQHIFHTDKDMLPLLDNHNDDDSWVSFEILRFFGRGILYFSMKALFNLPSLANNHFYDLFIKFNSKLPFFLLMGPFLCRILFKEEHLARETIIQMIKTAILNEECDDNRLLSEIFGQIHDLDLNLSDTTDLDSRARYTFLLFIASFFNTVPSVFWIIYQLLSDNNAYIAIQEEVDTIYKERLKIHNEEKKDKKEDDKTDTSSSLVFFELSDVQKMHRLDSLIKEVFRLKTTKQVMVNRVATDDFLMKIPIDNTIRTISIKKGTIFITSPTLTHTDEEIFANAKEFKWDRFLPHVRKDGTTALPKFFKNGVELRNPVNPFGGGKTYCPGRLLAVTEMKVMVAWMLLKYDFRFKNGIIPKDEPKLKSPKNAASNGYPLEDILIEARKRR